METVKLSKIEIKIIVKAIQFWKSEMEMQGQDWSEEDELVDRLQKLLPKGTK